MAKLKTGRHTSALKAKRQAAKHAIANREVRSRIRTIARRVEDAVTAKDAKSAQTQLNEAFSLWDKAAKTGLIHWRAAARTKARLAQKVGRLSAGQAA